MIARPIAKRNRCFLLVLRRPLTPSSHRRDGTDSRHQAHTDSRHQAHGPSNLSVNVLSVEARRVYTTFRFAEYAADPQIEGNLGIGLYGPCRSNPDLRVM